MAILPLLILLMVLGACVGLMATERGERGRRAVRPITEPCCPGCRYRLLGLFDPTCPECGHDLERGGVIDRRDPRRGLVACFRVVLLMPAALVAPMLVAVLLGTVRPRLWTWTTQATVRDLSPDAPPTSTRLVVERTRTLRARDEPSRDAFPAGRVRVIVPGPSDRELLDRAEADVRALADAALAGQLDRGLAEAGVEGPVDVSVAILRDLAEGSFASDPTGTLPAMRAIRDAVAGDRDVRILGTRDDVVWQQTPVAWPRTVGFAAGGLVLVAGGLITGREFRRGRPVPWSQVGSAARPADRESVS